MQAARKRGQHEMGSTGRREQLEQGWRREAKVDAWRGRKGSRNRASKRVDEKVERAERGAKKREYDAREMGDMR